MNQQQRKILGKKYKKLTDKIPTSKTMVNYKPPPESEGKQKEYNYLEDYIDDNYEDDKYCPDTNGHDLFEDLPDDETLEQEVGDYDLNQMKKYNASARAFRVTSERFPKNKNLLK